MAETDGLLELEKSLWQWARVDTVISPTQFQANRLQGYGDGYFNGWLVYVLRDTRSIPTVAAAPQGEQQTATGFTRLGGIVTHPAFTTPMIIGDEVILLYPGILAITKLGGTTPGVGGTAANWQTAEADIISIGADNIRNKLHSLILDINTLVGTVTIRLYQQVNGIERRCYQQAFTVAADGPGIWVVNGTVGIHEVLRVTAQSNNAVDNGQAIAYDYMLEAQ